MAVGVAAPATLRASVMTRCAQPHGGMQCRRTFEITCLGRVDHDDGPPRSASQLAIGLGSSNVGARQQGTARRGGAHVGRRRPDPRIHPDGGSECRGSLDIACLTPEPTRTRTDGPDGGSECRGSLDIACLGRGRRAGTRNGPAAERSAAGPLIVGVCAAVGRRDLRSAAGGCGHRRSAGWWCRWRPRPGRRRRPASAG